MRDISIATLTLAAICRRFKLEETHCYKSTFDEGQKNRRNGFVFEQGVTSFYTSKRQS